jgi:hypothetical protein
MEKSRKYTILKVAVTILYIAITAFLIGSVIDSMHAEGEAVQLGIALTYAIIVVIIGGIAYGISLIPSIIGIVLTSVGLKRKTNSFKSLLYFIIFTALPIITYLLMVFILPKIIN